ncbi:MAG: hypothetical protein ACR2MO_08645 [Acidimicrobiales bacterium]
MRSHRWVIIVTYEVDDETAERVVARDAAAMKLATAVYVGARCLSVTGPGCLHCGELLDEARHRPCPGEPA